MESFKVICFFATLSLAVALAQANCAEIYEQCGGKNFQGPTCCEQPELDPRYVLSSVDVIVCKRSNDYYSQCLPKCPEDRPCLVRSTGRCVATSLGTDGLGRQYCGPTTRCANPRTCFDNPASCVCGGSRPCQIALSPGGCTETGANGLCRNFSIRCPNFEGQQCGGKNHVEPKSCQPGLKCEVINEFFSQCVD